MFDQMQSVAAMIASYTNPARFSSRHCMLVARQLQSAAPKPLTPDQTEALALVLKRATEVDEVRMERQRVAPPSLRAPRFAMVSAWSSLRSALLALGAIPVDVSAEGPEAAALATKLFPNGIDFSTHDAGALWTVSRMLLVRIQDEGLRERIDALVSPRLLRFVEKAFAELGLAVGADGELPRLPARRALLEANTRFAFAVAAYGRALSVRLDETDPDALARFQSALAPIDAFRIVGRAAELADDDELEDGEDTEGGLVDAGGNGGPFAPGETPAPEDPYDPEFYPFVRPGAEEPAS
jgi:hypothetical protein